MRKNNQDIQFYPSYFYQDNKLYYRGKYIWVSFLKAEKLKISISRENILVCELPNFDVATIQRAILEWLRNETNQIILSVIKNGCPVIGKWPNKIVLKDQKTRWGSCGINDSIQINWRLIFAPEGILEYVVVHELAHLLYRNHGVNFWKTVAKCFPEYELARRWLRKNGDHLMRINLEMPFCSQESFRSLVESL